MIVPGQQAPGRNCQSDGRAHVDACIEFQAECSPQWCHTASHLTACVNHQGWPARWSSLYPWGCTGPAQGKTLLRSRSGDIDSERMPARQCQYIQENRCRQWCQESGFEDQQNCTRGRHAGHAKWAEGQREVGCKHQDDEWDQYQVQLPGPLSNRSEKIILIKKVNSLFPTFFKLILLTSKLTFSVIHCFLKVIWKLNFYGNFCWFVDFCNFPAMGLLLHLGFYKVFNKHFFGIWLWKPSWYKLSRITFLCKLSRITFMCKLSRITFLCKLAELGLLLRASWQKLLRRWRLMLCAVLGSLGRTNHVFW